MTVLRRGLNVNDLLYGIVIALSVSIFLSITITEALYFALLIVLLLQIKTQKLNSLTDFGKLLGLFLILGLFTDALNQKNALSVEMYVFSAVYFLFLNDSRVQSNVPTVLVSIGILSLPIAGFKALQGGILKKLFWGGGFASAELLFISSFALLHLFVTRTRVKTQYGTVDKLGFLLLFAYFLTIFFAMSTHKRSLFLGSVFLVSLYLFKLYRSGFPIKRLAIVTVIAWIAGLSWYTVSDPRFHALMKYFFGTKSFETLAKASSGRNIYLTNALTTLQTLVGERNWTALMFGVGTEGSIYFESFLPVSLLLEKGVVGLILYFGLVIQYFRTFIRFNVRDSDDMGLLFFALPLGLHFIKTLFTVWWSALLPFELLLFRVFELGLNRSKRWD